MLLYMKEKGKLVPEVGGRPLRDEILEYMNGMKDYNFVEIIFQPPKSKKSINQLKYIHWVFRVIAKDIGETMDNIKHYCKVQFGQWRNFEINGDELTKEISLKDYNKLEMTNFIQDVMDWAKTLNIIIPTEEEWNDKHKS